MIDNIKAIMLDLDGTLLNSNGTVSPRTIEAIAKARDEGLLIGLCTGRDVHSVKTLMKEWGIDEITDAVVGTGGAEIYDRTLNVDKANYPLDGAFIKEIMKHYEDMDINWAIPDQGILVAPKEDEFIKMLSIGDHVPYKVVDYDEFLKQPRMKAMIVCAPQEMDKVIERSKSFHNDQYKCASLKTASILFEYMDPRVSKTNGLQDIMQMHGWTLDNILSFGDEDNDYDMIVNTGVGVVMANGSAKTKAAADYITGDNDHDGIADFLEEHIL